MVAICRAPGYMARLTRLTRLTRFCSETACEGINLKSLFAFRRGGPFRVHVLRFISGFQKLRERGSTC